MLKAGKPCIMEVLMPGGRLTKKLIILDVYIAIASEFKDS